MKTWHFSSFYFFYFTTIGVLIPYWGLFLQHRGFNAEEIGQLMAILLLTKVIAPNIWASVADSIAAKKGSALGILKFASFAAFLIYSLLYLVSSFWATALIMLGFCVFWNASLPQIEAATLNHLSDNNAQYGRVRLWGSVSFILTVLCLGPLMDMSGAGVVLPAGAIAFFLAFIASLLMRDVSAVRPPIYPNDRSVSHIFSQLTATTIVLLGLCIFMQISHAPWQAFFSIYLESYGYSKLSISLLYSIGVVFEIFVFIAGFVLLKRFRLLSLLSFTFLVTGVRWCLLALFPESLLLVTATQIMHAITYGLYHSVMIQLVHKIFVGRYQVRGQALYSSITYGVGGAIGSFISGYVWTGFSPNHLFLFAGVMMFVVFLSSLVFIAKVGRQFE